MSNLFNIFSKETPVDPINKGVVANTDADLIAKLNSGEFNLVLDNARYPLNSLTTIFEDYDLDPEYQRNYIWDDARKSRLIESFVANIPIPPIFLYETEYNKYEVMDGLQRISTIIKFFKNEFVLKDLVLWPELNGKKFNDLLPEFKNAIKRRYLSAIIVVKESNSQQKADLLKTYTFERLNTGGMNLTNQEIRNAVYLGPVNSIINKIGRENQLFISMYSFGNNSSDSADRFQTSEMVLRFFAYKDALKNHISYSTKKILDEYIKRSTNKDENFADSLNVYFENIINIVNDVFGMEAFSRGNKFEKMIFDTVMLATSDLYDEGINFKSIKHNVNKNNTLKNNYFSQNKDQFNGKYTSLSNVNARLNMFKTFVRTQIL